MEHTLTITDVADEAVRQAIVGPLVEYNQSQAGPSQSRPLIVFLRTGAGEVVGGLWGDTGYEWLFTQLLFVPANLRGTGVGTEIMRLAEAEATARGCHSAWLDTHEFQARGFYERLGYVCFGELPNYPSGFSRFFMQKQLAKAPSSRHPFIERTSCDDVAVDVRLLLPTDAVAYRLVRLRALEESPPVFGSLPEDEPDLPETVARLAASDDRCFFGAFWGERLVGIVRLSRYEAPNEKHRAYLGGLFVLPSFRRCGCGRALVQAALSRAANLPSIRRVNLSVVAHQEAAIRLYQSLGFRHYGTEQEAFSRAARFYDEHLMTLPLLSSGQ